MAEFEDLITTLQSIKETPKVKNAAELKEWMKEFLKEDIPKEVKTEGAMANPSTTSSYFNPPRLTFFSGNNKAKGETTYDLWRHELRCLVNDQTHSNQVIGQAIRRSLRGEAGRVVMRLGPHAEVGHVLQKMDSVYGVVEEKESVMREFYNACQKDDEDITTWSCRLEDILEKAIQIDKVKRSEADAMLHDMLWKGLKPHLRDTTHYEKEKYITFDQLRVALRKLEKDNQIDQPAKPTPKATSKKAIANVDENKEKDDLKGILLQITSRLDTLEAGPGQSYQHGQSYRGGGRGNFRGSYRGNSYRGNSYQGNSYRGNNYRGNQSNYRGNSYRGNQPTDSPQFPPIICRRCGQEGHIARGCRVNLNKESSDEKPLNYRESTPRSRT